MNANQINSKKPRRIAFTTEQLNQLEEEFSKSKYMSKTEQRKLAAQFGVEAPSIKVRISQNCVL